MNAKGDHARSLQRLLDVTTASRDAFVTAASVASSPRFMARLLVRADEDVRTIRYLREQLAMTRLSVEYHGQFEASENSSSADDDGATCGIHLWESELKQALQDRADPTMTNNKTDTQVRGVTQSLGSRVRLATRQAAARQSRAVSEPDHDIRSLLRIARSD